MSSVEPSNQQHTDAVSDVAAAAAAAAVDDSKRARTGDGGGDDGGGVMQLMDLPNEMLDAIAGRLRDHARLRAVSRQWRAVVSEHYKCVRFNKCFGKEAAVLARTTFGAVPSLLVPVDKGVVDSGDYYLRFWAYNYTIPRILHLKKYGYGGYDTEAEARRLDAIAALAVTPSFVHKTLPHIEPFNGGGGGGSCLVMPTSNELPAGVFNNLKNALRLKTLVITQWTPTTVMSFDFINALDCIADHLFVLQLNGSFKNGVLPEELFAPRAPTRRALLWSLTKLDVSHMNIVSLPDDLLTVLPALRHLEAICNHLTVLPARTFATDSPLRVIRVQNNRLTPQALEQLWAAENVGRFEEVNLIYMNGRSAEDTELRKWLSCVECRRIMVCPFGGRELPLPVALPCGATICHHCAYRLYNTYTRTENLWFGHTRRHPCASCCRVHTNVFWEQSDAVASELGEFQNDSVQRRCFRQERLHLARDILYAAAIIRFFQPSLLHIESTNSAAAEYPTSAPRFNAYHRQRGSIPAPEAPALHDPYASLYAHIDADNWVVAGGHALRVYTGDRWTVGDLDVFYVGEPNESIELIDEARRWRIAHASWAPNPHVHEHKQWYESIVDVGSPSTIEVVEQPLTNEYDMDTLPRHERMKIQWVLYCDRTLEAAVNTAAGCAYDDQGDDGVLRDADGVPVSDEQQRARLVARRQCRTRELLQRFDLDVCRVAFSYTAKAIFPPNVYDRRDGRFEWTTTPEMLKAVQTRQCRMHAERSARCPTQLINRMRKYTQRGFAVLPPARLSEDAAAHGYTPNATTTCFVPDCVHRTADAVHKYKKNEEKNDDDDDDDDDDAIAVVGN